MEFKFYSNENFPRPVVEEMRKLGFDVLTSQDAGKSNQRIPDEEVLAFAHENKRVLLTINRKDFIKLHREWDAAKGLHPGIIVCTRDEDFPRQAKRIVEAVSNFETLTGELIKVYRPDK